MSIAFAIVVVVTVGTLGLLAVSLRRTGIGRTRGIYAGMSMLMFDFALISMFLVRSQTAAVLMEVPFIAAAVWFVVLERRVLRA